MTKMKMTVIALLAAMLFSACGGKPPLITDADYAACGYWVAVVDGAEVNASWARPGGVLICRSAYSDLFGEKRRNGLSEEERAAAERDAEIKFCARLFGISEAECADDLDG